MAVLAVASLVFALVGAAATSDPPVCLLQVNSERLVQNHNAALNVAEAPNCPLPANGKWCKVQLGAANFNMAVYNTADIVSDTICQSGTWELQAGDITALGEPGAAIDIGANVGFYSFVLAAHGWNVTSFEPMAANHELLDATMCANPLLKQKITLNKFGLGAKDDHCIIISGDDNLGDGLTQWGEDAKKPIQAGYHQRATMDVRRLDDVLTEQQVSKVDFVKMDVEGFECQVMAGGQSLLTKFRPKLIQSEVWHDMQGCQPEDYLKSFAKASYSVTKDRSCTQPGLVRPAGIENRYMCREPEQKGLSLLEMAASLKSDERRIVWLIPDEQPHAMFPGALNVAEAHNCPLPANGKWCTVQLGPANFSMAVYNTTDIVSDTICQSGTWELQPGDITALGEPGSAIDIGANVGFYSFVLAAHGWNVTSFEPMAANHKLLDATMCANPLLKQKITLNKFGLGAKDDHCIIISDDDNLGDGITQCGEDAKKPIQAGYHQRASMDVRRLDDVLTEQQVSKVDFVKMDVEGFECQVMAGGQSLLTKFRPKLIQSEVWHDMQGCKPEDYLKSFAEASYSVTKDRSCTQPGLVRPAGIENRYMCREPEQKGVSLLEMVASIKSDERRTVWLTPDAN